MSKHSFDVIRVLATGETKVICSCPATREGKNMANDIRQRQQNNFPMETYRVIEHKS